MIYGLTESEQNIKATIIKRWAPRLGMTKEELGSIMDTIQVEVHQKKPFTTAITRKTVLGKQVRGVGFVKYNPNDAKMGPGYAWNESRGRIIAISRALQDFMSNMPKKNTNVKAVVGDKELAKV